MPYVLDTNIFNRIVDGSIAFDDLPTDESLVATYVQIDEINNTKDTERRARLFLAFADVRPQIISTESFVWDVSRWDRSKWSDGVLYQVLKNEIDSLNKSKPNNVQDTLIGEVAIVNGCTLLTTDNDLATVVRKHGGKVILYKA